MWKFIGICLVFAAGYYVGHWHGIIQVSGEVSKICDAYSCRGTHK